MDQPLRYYTEVGQPVERLPPGGQTKDNWRIEADAATSTQSDRAAMPGVTDRDIGLWVCSDCAYHEGRTGEPWLETGRRFATSTATSSCSWQRSPTGRFRGSAAGQTSMASRTVTVSPTSSPSAFRTPAFTGTM